MKKSKQALLQPTDIVVLIAEILLVSFFALTHRQELEDIQYALIFVGVTFALFCAGLVMKKYDKAYEKQPEKAELKHPFLFGIAMLCSPALGVLGVLSLLTATTGSTDPLTLFPEVVNGFLILGAVCIVPGLYYFARKKNSKRKHRPMLSAASSWMINILSIATLNLLYIFFFMFSKEEVSFPALALLIFIPVMTAVVYLPSRYFAIANNPDAKHTKSILMTIIVLSAYVFLLHFIA